MSDPSEALRRRALIVKFGQIGDVIMALPAARALYEQGYSIDWISGRAAHPLLAAYSWIHVIAVDDRAILRGAAWERTRHIAQLWARFAFRRYDLCATLYYDRRFHLLTMPIRATRKIALSQSRETTLLAGRHHTDEYVRLLLDREDGYQSESTPPVRPDRLPPSALALSRAARRVGIAPGGTSNVLGEQILRRWPVANYVTLTQRMVERGWEVLLLGGPEDAWVRPHFAHLTVTDLIGKLALPEVISTCDDLDAVVTHDTGPLHLAGLSRAALIGIFGPTDPATRVPRRANATGIWGGQGFACRPCYDGRNFAPCVFNGCMQQVTPERVLQEVDLLLIARARGTDRPWSIVFP